MKQILLSKTAQKEPHDTGSRILLIFENIKSLHVQNQTKSSSTGNEREK